MSLIDKDLRTISGAKGKSDSGGSGTELPDTLRSSTKVALIEALGEGPIWGLINGANSIYINNTPVKNTDGTPNLVGIEWDQRTGLPEQAPLPGPAQTSTMFTVETQVKNSTPIIRTIDDPTTQAVQVVIRIPALLNADKVTGDVKGTSLQFTIERRAAGGGWETIIPVQISNQKVASPYKRQFTVAAPDSSGQPWDIRVSRQTADPDPVESQFLQNQTWWESYSTIVTGRYTYDDTALISLYVDAFTFGSSLGTRAYHVRGLLIKVPTNYDPIAKTYSGIWNGSFKVAWSNNPAWVFYDLLTNSRYGIGEFIDPAAVDKWGMYTIGQYCDQLVPSGYKNNVGQDILEPRFTFNGVINNREEAYKVLQNIATAFRGMAYWSLGQVFAAADMPSDPVAAFSPANVIDGHFKYSGTAMKARNSVAVVQWNDPNNYFRITPEVVQDDDMIRRFGWRQKDVRLIGCTSRGQALRFGKWILDSEANQTETVQFSISWDGYVLKENQSLRPGQVVMVSDPRKNGNFRAGGRLAQVNSAIAVTLDFPFQPETGQTYTVSALLPDGSFETRIVSDFGADLKTVTLSQAFTAPPVTNADFIIQSANMVARQYRVLAVQEDGENIFKITALIHDPNKYARVEQGVAFDPIPYVRPRNVIAPVSGVAAVEARFFQSGISHSRVTLSWTGPSDFSVADYLVTADSPHGFVSFPATTMPSLDILDAAAGSWTFYVVARARTGLTAIPVTFPFTVEGWEAVTGPVPNNLDTLAGSGLFTGRAPTLQWNNVFPPNYVQYAVTNIVRVYDVSGNLLRTERVSTPSFTYNYEKNVNDGGPRRTFRIDVTALNVTGIESATASIVISNPTPAKIIPTLRGDVGSIDVSWVNSDSDYTGAMAWVSTNSGYVPDLEHPNYNGPDTKVTLWVEGGTQYVWVGLYDAFGTEGMIISDPQHLTIDDLQSRLAGVIPGLIQAAGQVTTGQLTDATENISDQIAGVLGQIILDRDFNDERHARQVQELSVRADNMSASVTQEITSRIEANFVEATARQVLEATINTAVLAQIASESVARATADTAITSQITSALSQIASNSAAITTEATTRATADSAQASQYTTLATTVGGNTANISTVQSSVDGVKLQYGVIGTINGTTGGFLFTGIKKLDGSVSYTLQIAGDVIVDGTILAQKMNVMNLSAISANMGTITAGLIQSTSGNFRIDCTNERIEIWS